MNTQVKLPLDVVAEVAGEALIESGAPTKRQTNDDDFDWNKSENIALNHQPATAVYLNAMGGLVIRQEREWDREEDPLIIITPSNNQEFLDRVCDVLGIGSVRGST